MDITVFLLGWVEVELLSASPNLVVMEIAETKCSSGYGKPPWIFKGRHVSYKSLIYFNFFHFSLWLNFI